MNKNKIPSLEDISSSKVLIVGDVMLDRYWFGDVNRISPEAPVPIVHIRNEDDRPGGAANVAINVKSLGSETSLLGIIGNDDLGKSLQDIIEKKEIKTSFIKDSSVKTIMKLRVIGQNHQMIRIDFEKKYSNKARNALLNKFESLINKHDIVLFSDYDKGALDCISKMIKIAKKAGKFVLVDPKKNNWDIYAGADIITPNRSELSKVIGNWSCEVELQKKSKVLIESLNFKAIVLTRSEEGMTLIEDGVLKSVGAQTNEVVDVTGAGDTAIATLAVLIACGVNFYDAMSMANKAGSFVVQKFGTVSLDYKDLIN